MRTLHHTHPRKLRLTIKKRQDDPQPPTHTPRPPQTAQTRRTQLSNNPPHSVLTNLQQTILTIIKQVIKRLTRHTRTRSDTRHSHIRPAQLLNRRHRTTQQARALHLRDTHTTITHSRRQRRRTHRTTHYAVPAPRLSVTTLTRHQCSPPIKKGERRDRGLGSKPRRSGTVKPAHTGIHTGVVEHRDPA